MSPFTTGARIRDLETLPLLELDRFFPLSSFFTMLLSRRCLLALFGCRSLRFVEVVRTFGSDRSHISLDGT